MGIRNNTIFVVSPIWENWYYPIFKSEFRSNTILGVDFVKISLSTKGCMLYYPNGLHLRRETPPPSWWGHSDGEALTHAAVGNGRLICALGSDDQRTRALVGNGTRWTYPLIIVDHCVHALINGGARSTYARPQQQVDWHARQRRLTELCSFVGNRWTYALVGVGDRSMRLPSRLWNCICCQDTLCLALARDSPSRGTDYTTGNLVHGALTSLRLFTKQVKHCLLYLLLSIPPIDVNSMWALPCQGFHFARKIACELCLRRGQILPTIWVNECQFIFKKH